MINSDNMLQKIQSDQSTIIENQNLMLETIKFILDLAVNNQNELKTLDRKLENLPRIIQTANNIKNQIDNLSKELKEQKNVIKQLLGNAKNENKQYADKINKQMTDQLNKFEKSLTTIKNNHGEINNKINAITMKSNGISEKFNELEQMIKIINVNQVIDKKKRFMPATINDKDKPSDIDILQLASETDNSDAIYKLALIYFNGSDGANKNLNLAFELFQKSAINGNMKAIKMLIDCYKNGWGTNKNNQNADYWQKKLKSGS